MRKQLEEHHHFCRSKHCPGCGHKLHAKPDWMGLPAGVKFDPTDQELIEHLEAKVRGKDMKSHPLIDEFIPTIEGDDGICYTHPEKLPGVTRDGLSRHFFHRPSKAYTTGTRKRRKIIQNESSGDVHGGGETRWHKTGKTRPVMVNGRQKGCKKILVLYTNFGKNRKPEKTNWVMHQYHLGLHEEEREGELVVSKIFYQTQPRQCNWSSDQRSNNSVAGDGRDSASSGNCSSNNLQVGEEISRLLLSRRGLEILDIGEASTGRESMQVNGTCEDIYGGRSTSSPSPSSSSISNHMINILDYHQQHRIGATNNAYQYQLPSSSSSSSSSYPITSILSNPYSSSMMNVDEDNSFINIPRIMLPFNVPFQQQHHQQEQHYYHKAEGRSGSGLEELIMGCTSTTPTYNYVKDESSSIPTNAQEAEWLKYSSFWSDP